MIAKKKRGHENKFASPKYAENMGMQKAFFIMIKS